MTLELGYVVISSIIAAIDIIIGIMGFLKDNTLGKLLGVTCLAAALVDFTYLMSTTIGSDYLSSLFSSLYFMCIDLLLNCLLLFVLIYCKIGLTKLVKCIYKCSVIFMLYEFVMFMYNVKTHIAVDYIIDWQAMSVVRYEMKPLYYLHLVYTYAIVAAVLFLFLYKTFHSAYEYKRKYAVLAGMLMFIVIVNGIFLFPFAKGILSVDVSVLFYSVDAIFTYWFCFNYTKSSLFRYFKTTIFDTLEQGIILFDIDNNMMFKNSKLDSYFSQYVLNESLTLEEFIKVCDFDHEILAKNESYSFQCFMDVSDQYKKPLRCDYRNLKNQKDQYIGTIFTFVDVQQETDILTGFHNWESFSGFVRENPSNFSLPLSIAYCDINNLSIINTTYGRNSGDMLISELADKMKNMLPSGTYFVRGNDANLIAICKGSDIDNIILLMETVKYSFSGTMQYAVSVADNSNPSIIEAIYAAKQGMKSRKLLDSDSIHSEALGSFIRALKECDDDTEAHVVRTRKLGEQLGKRIGLTDIQQSHLGLLCIMHDIGKIGIPLEILNKPGKLTSDEWTVLKSHVEKGYQIALSSSEYEPIAEMIRHHHERWDGTGYPDGLSKESIPVLSRVIAVVDAFDAMTNKRVYRMALSVDEAKQELKKCAGNQFDPRIVAAFIEMLEDINYEADEEYTFDGDSDTPNNAVSDWEISISYEPLSRSEVSTVDFTKYILNKDMRIIDIDENFTSITGYSLDDIESSNMLQFDLIPEGERSEYAIKVNEMVADHEILFFEHKLAKKSGEIIPVICMGRQFFDSVTKEQKSEIIIANSTKLNINKLAEKTVREQSRLQLKHWERTYRNDSLTGLLNHNAYVSDVENMLMIGRSVVFVMIDVDFFKNFNDTFGHRAGDEFLIQVANSIRTSIGENDLACRMGGDEFSIALIYEESPDMNHVTSRIAGLFDSLNAYLKQFEFNTGLSMGVAVSDGNVNTFNKLYDIADKKLYEIKNEGRGKAKISEDNN